MGFHRFDEGFPTTFGQFVSVEKFFFDVTFGLRNGFGTGFIFVDSRETVGSLFGRRFRFRDGSFGSALGGIELFFVGLRNESSRETREEPHDGGDDGSKKRELFFDFVRHLVEIRDEYGGLAREFDLSGHLGGGLFHIARAKRIGDLSPSDFFRRVGGDGSGLFANRRGTGLGFFESCPHSPFDFAKAGVLFRRHSGFQIGDDVGRRVDGCFFALGEFAPQFVGKTRKIAAFLFVAGDGDAFFETFEKRFWRNRVARNFDGACFHGFVAGFGHGRF
jgi:hypothetical protein